jgi:hypothetical protein
MARYRFHCTNGHECIFDATGAELRLPGSLAGRADQVARKAMCTLDDRTDWSDWRVVVCDLKGRRVLLQPFVPTGEKRPALEARPSEGFAPRHATSPAPTALNP